MSVEERPQRVKLGVVQGEISLDTLEALGEPSGAAMTAQAAAWPPAQLAWLMAPSGMGLGCALPLGPG